MCCSLSLTKSPFIKKKKEKKERGLAQIYIAGLAQTALDFLWVASFPKKPFSEKLLPTPSPLHAYSRPINNSLLIPKLSTLPCHICKMGMGHRSFTTFYKLGNWGQVLHTELVSTWATRRQCHICSSAMFICLGLPKGMPHHPLPPPFWDWQLATPGCGSDFHPRG